VSAATELQRYVNSIQFGLEGGRPSLTHEIAGPFGVSAAGFEPPRTVVYTAAPRPLRTSSGEWIHEGNLGYRIRLTPEFEPPKSDHWYESAWVRVTGVGLVLVGVGLAGGTIVEDILSGGLGLVDDPATFYAAWKVMQQGGRMVLQGAY